VKVDEIIKVDPEKLGGTPVFVSMKSLPQAWMEIA